LESQWREQALPTLVVIDQCQRAGTKKSTPVIYPIVLERRLQMHSIDVL
jgi:hypothetical protein